ncbi:MAG: repair protein [Bacteroidota bacterium]|jgi:DNA repair protein RadC|nr:repair protein [Bacteroidota bacterium]
MEKLCEITVNYSSKIKKSLLPKISTSDDAEKLFKEVWSNRLEFVEEVYLLLLNRANKVLGFTKISEGGSSGTVVETKVVFQTLLKGNASSFIMAHNHPSGNLKPSDSDIRLTKNIKEAGRIMDIPLVDHIIISDEGYYSFADEGLL